MSSQTWVREVIAVDPVESDWHWRGKRELFASRWEEFVRDPTLILTASDWNRLCSVVARTSALILWDGRESLSFRLELIRLLRSFLEKMTLDCTEFEPSSYMFWDVIAIQARGLDEDALPSLAVELQYRDQAVANSVFDALRAHLSADRKFLQLAALQGLSQLGDPRTPALIDSLRNSLFDDEVRQIAVRAARFEPF